MDARTQKLWQRGMDHFRQGNMAAAQASFESFLAREPDSGPARFRLSLVQARRGRYLAAIALAEQALAIDPPGAEILSHLARCHLAGGQPEAAREYANRALALPRDRPVVLDSLGVVMTRLDEPMLALSLFDQALALQPGHPSMHFNRALARRQFGLAEAAVEDLEACLASQPGHAKAHWTLALLRTQDQAGNHVPRLRRQLDLALADSPEEELLALALFKETDDLAEAEVAWPLLRRAIACRRGRAPASPMTGSAIDALIDAFDEKRLRRKPAPKVAAPIFVFGMPRSGVALMGSLLSRHSRVQHLGSQHPFERLLSQRLGQDSPAAIDPVQLAQHANLDFEQLGRDFVARVGGAGTAVHLCESHPMDFLLAGCIARALPGARMLHMVRDPLDNAVSILAHAGTQGMPAHDPAALAECFVDHQRLMEHWHRVLPERILDVSYESLVAKPEMILRVICSFLGIRYGSSLRMGLQLHQRSIGRGHRYGARLPALESGLAALERKSRIA